MASAIWTFIRPRPYSVVDGHQPRLHTFGGASVHLKRAANNAEKRVAFQRVKLDDGPGDDYKVLRADLLAAMTSSRWLPLSGCDEDDDDQIDAAGLSRTRDLWGG